MYRNAFSYSVRSFSKRITRRSTRTPAPPTLSVEQSWTPVTDKVSGGIYYWNTLTNETTHIGAPNPALKVPPPPTATGSNPPLAINQAAAGGGGLGRVVAEGMAFGVGSSIAHHAVGSLFGGGHSHHHAPSQAPVEDLNPPSGGDDSGGFFDSFEL